VVGVELALQLFLGHPKRNVLDHHAKISSSNGIVVDQSLMFDLEPVYQKETDHPDHDHSHQQPTLYYQRCLQRSARAVVQQDGRVR
jgi:hypothetical protein